MSAAAAAAAAGGSAGSAGGADGTASPHKRAVLLMKTGRSAHALRHVWFNSFDPLFLRYAPEADFRGVKVISLNPADVTLTWSVDRAKKRAEEPIAGRYRKHRLKVVERGNVPGSRKSWSIYFESAAQLEEWRALIEKGASAAAPPGSELSKAAAEQWWDQQYGSERKLGSASSRRLLVPAAGGGAPQQPNVTLRFELPENMGYLFMRVDFHAARFLTVRRLKELLFEAAHAAYHGAPGSRPAPEEETSASPPRSRAGGPSASNGSALPSPTASPSGPATPTSAASPAGSSRQLGLAAAASSSSGLTSPKPVKYADKRHCSLCGGAVRQVVSRHMHRQEDLLLQDPSFFAIERVSVDEIDPTKIAWVETYAGEVMHRYQPRSTAEAPFSGSSVPAAPAPGAAAAATAASPTARGGGAAPASGSAGGGLYRDQPESEFDGAVLRSLKFRRPRDKPPASTDSSKKLDVTAVTPATDPVDEYDKWLATEDATLRSELDKLAPMFSTMAAAVVRFKLRPARDVPVAAFRVTVDRYTRETDARGEYTLYSLTVRSGSHLHWEIRRRFIEFVELHESLCAEQAVLSWVSSVMPPRPRSASSRLVSRLRSRPSPLPQLPFPGKGRPTPVEEAARMRELAAYVNAVVALPPMRAAPSASLLSFLGALSTGVPSAVLTRLGKDTPRVVHVHALSAVAEYGDLVLFRSVNSLSSLQRRVTGGEYDHVGMVVPKDGSLRLLEATGEGVTCYPLEDRLIAYADGFCDLVALRKIKFERTKERLVALTAFSQRVEGRPYRLNVRTIAGGRLARRASSLVRRGSAGAGAGAAREAQGAGEGAGGGAGAGASQAYFCSELCAEALRAPVLGLLTTKHKDSYWLPHHFNPGGELERVLDPEVASLEDPVIVDCKLVEIEFASAG